MSNLTVRLKTDVTSAKLRLINRLTLSLRMTVTVDGTDKSLTPLEKFPSYVKVAIASRKLNDEPLVGGGSWNPGSSVLLIGDEFSHSNKNFHIPFMSFLNTGCSLWLANKLDQAGVNEEGLYWSNSRLDGREISPEYIYKLNPRAVIALGSNASKWCRKHEIEHIETTHPMYHKRFHHDEPYALIEYLKDLTREKRLCQV